MIPKFNSCFATPGITPLPQVLGGGHGDGLVPVPGLGPGLQPHLVRQQRHGRPGLRGRAQGDGATPAGQNTDKYCSNITLSFSIFVFNSSCLKYRTLLNKVLFMTGTFDWSLQYIISK